MDGVIVVYKEKGFTSHDVVAKLRGILHQRKIGHTGTLDPDAVGVLPVALGRATKLVDMITDHEKTYRAVMRLGVTTDTQDMSGTVLAERPVTAGETEIRETVLSFIGEQDQIPPMYSAVKVGGKKLYELAREGVEIERAPRRIVISEIDIETAELPLVTFTVRCSKGTYIRTLCRDIGEKLGCGAAMQELTRTAVGHLTIDKAVTLGQIQEAADAGDPERYLTPLKDVLAGMQVFACGNEHRKALVNGNAVRLAWGTGDIDPSEPVLVTDETGEIIGIYRCDGDVLKPGKMLL